MKNEANVLPIFAAAGVSVAVSLSLFWTSPVVIGLGGLSVFCLIVKTGWSVTGTDNVEGITLLNLSGLWLLMALIVWFGLIGPVHWPWFLSAFLLLAWLTGLAASFFRRVFTWKQNQAGQANAIQQGNQYVEK